MSERSYSRIDQIWRDNHHVTIIYPDGSQLCRLPVLYLEKSGTNDWKLVQDIVQALITEPIAVFEENGSELQDMSGIPVSGQYTVRHRDPTSRSEELTPKLGPEGNTRHYPLDDTARSSKSGSPLLHILFHSLGLTFTNASTFRKSLKTIYSNLAWECC